MADQSAQTVPPQSDAGNGAAPSSQTPPGHPTQPRVHTTWKATIRTALLAAVAVTVVLLAFAWPTKTSSVHDVPITVVGSGDTADQVTTKLKESGAFSVSTAASADAARTQIQHRESYGAVVLPSTPGGSVEVLTASAASPVVSQLLNQVAGQLTQASAAQAGAAKQQAAQAASQAGAKAAASAAVVQTLTKVAATNPAIAPQLAAAKTQATADAAAAQQAGGAVEAIQASTVTVTDVVPLAKDDARGTGLGIAALPLAMGGMIGGVLISLLVAGAKRRVAAVLGYAAVGGLALAAILGPWFGFLPNFWGSAAVISGALLGTAATIVGLHALLGQVGIPIGAVLTMFIGNPLSSANAPIEFLPSPWGTIGQALVPGASSTLLRLVNYFPDASITFPVIALAAWSALGLLLMLTGHFRSQEVVHVAGDVEPDPA